MPILRRAAHSLLRWRVASLAVAAVGFIAACERDTITGPDSVKKEGPPVAQFNTDPAPLPPPVGSEVPYGITRRFETHDGNGSIAFQKIGQIPRPLVGRMTIRQRAVQSGPDRGTLVAGPQGIYVPGFYDERCVLKAGMGYRYANGGGWTEDWRPHDRNCPTPWVEEETNPNLTWLADSAGIYGGRSDGSYELCGRGCHSYGGYTTFIFTPTSNVVTLTATPTSVTEGFEVKFTARRSDVLLTSVYGWIWRPADTTQTPQTVACAGTDTTCTTRVFEDGRMFVQVLISGYLHTAQAGVRVKLAKVVVTPSNPAPTYGDSVTYTASTDPAGVPEFAAKEWRFVPDDTAQQPTTHFCAETSCTIAARAAGTMHVVATLARRTDSASVHTSLYRRKLRLTPTDTVRVQPNGTVTFAASAEGATLSAVSWRALQYSASVLSLSPRLQPSFSVSSASTLTAAASSILASTCVAGATTCNDQVGGGLYTRIVEATVDDSVQTASVVVQTIVMVEPGSDLPVTCDSTRTPACRHSPLDSAQRAAIDSIIRNHVQTKPKYCRDVRDSLTVLYNTGRILTFDVYEGSFGNFHSVGRYIDLWIGIFGPAPADVRIGTDSQGQALYVRRKRNTLEASLVHEGIHVTGAYTHPQGGNFPRDVVQRCMDPTHTDWSG